MHWAAQYIGRKWTVDGFGPDEFNCWGLLWWIYRRHYATELPKYANVSPKELAATGRAFQEAATSSDWQPLAAPVDGCVVGMSSHKLIHHVGLYLDVDGGLVLHACEGKGTLCQSIATLKAHGWSRLSFYIHKSWPVTSVSSK